MRTYGQHISELSSLEAFDPAAFTPTTGYSQELCGFVLGLALAFNDFHDLLVAHDILISVWPSNETDPTPELGEFNGLSQHLFRLHLATLHEVLAFIAHNKRSLNELSLGTVLTKMTPAARSAWETITEVALGTISERSRLTEFLLFARNKVAFHYDRKEIASGFAKAFVQNTAREPFVSRGDTLASARFHFADAAAQDYMRKKAEEFGAPNSIIEALEFMTDVTFALHQLVFTFITSRGFAWRQPRSAG